jgi:hypothetical protein
MIANILHNYSDPKTMAMAECKPLARTKTNKGCNPRRISLAPPIEFPIRESICFLLENNKVVRKQGL